MTAPASKLTVAQRKVLRLAVERGAVHAGWNPIGGENIPANVIGALERKGLITTKYHGVGAAGLRLMKLNLPSKYFYITDAGRAALRGGK